MIKEMNGLEKATRGIVNSPLGIILFIVSAAAFFMPYELPFMLPMEAFLPIVQKICIGLLIILFFMLYISRISFFTDNLLLFATAICVALLIYITTVNGGWIESAWSDNGFFAIPMLLLMSVFFKVNLKRYLLIFFIVFLIYTCANNYTVFSTWGVGMWNDEIGGIDDRFSLVGNYNGGIKYVIITMLAGTAWASKYGKWLDIFNWALLIFSIAASIKCKSDTQTFAYALIAVVMIFNSIMYAWKGIYHFLKIFNAAVLMAINLVIFYLFVMGKGLELLAKIGIASDFHNRRGIWDAALNAIPNHQPLGIGAWTDIGTVPFLPPTDAAHCHCMYLEVPFRVGYIGTAVYIIMILLTVIAIMRSKNRHHFWLFSAFMGITFLAAQVESYNLVYFSIIMGLCYYASKTDRREALMLETDNPESENTGKKNGASDLRDADAEIKSGGYNRVKYGGNDRTEHSGIYERNEGYKNINSDLNNNRYKYNAPEELYETRVIPKAALNEDKGVKVVDLDEEWKKIIADKVSQIKE